MQELVSVDGASSPEKNDTKISNFGSVVCFLWHILWDNIEVNNFPSQLKLGVNECHFGLSQLWAKSHSTLLMRISKRAGCWCKECTLIKLIGLWLTTMTSQNDIHSHLVLSEKENFWASTLSHKMCPRKQTTEPNFYLTLIPVIVSTYFVKYAVLFWGHPVFLSWLILGPKEQKKACPWS